MTSDDVVLQTEIAGLRLAGRGKVRDIYDLGDRLLIIATDRISAFDCVLPTGIPDKGHVLTALSRFWFERIGDIVPEHLDRDAEANPPPELKAEWPRIAKRSMLAKKAKPFPVECVVRGYLSGSAWKEYRQNSRTATGGSVECAGVQVPAGLTESAKLPEPVFTPATKETDGHDINISFAQAADIIGRDTAARLRDYSLAIYQRAADYAAGRGIIIADTKFEFGLWNGQILLIDEVLTPDSSRFWNADSYSPGQSQPSYDKQFVRDYLETLDWDKNPPAPSLPADIVERTANKYREAFERLTGRKL